MGTEIKVHINEDKYHVVSINKSNPPDGATAGNWYRYVIEKGKSKIEGFKCGSFVSVSEHAENVTEDINQRAECFRHFAYHQITWKRN
jgi:hypothetical protein